MNFLKKIFRSDRNEQPENKKKKQKTSFVKWLCASKQQQQSDSYEATGLEPITQQSSAKKSSISFARTNSTKIVQRLSFGVDKKDLVFEELKGQIVSIGQQRINRIEELLERDGLYGVVNSQQPLVDEDSEKGIWLQIGKEEQINSLVHIKPYHFDKIFIVFDEFGGQFSISEILNSKQNIYLRVQSKDSVQRIIDEYEKQLVQRFSFKLLSECFSKLKITVFRTNKNHVWLRLNEQIETDFYAREILNQMGFDQTHEEYEKLKQQIPKRLTLHQYMNIIEHKQKLLSKYQGQSVEQYIRSKFLQKISSNAPTHRNDSPCNLQKEKLNKQQLKEEVYEEYILSMTANTLSKQRIAQSNNNQPPTKNNDKNSFEEEIFQFNVYKDDKEQEEKRVAITKQRKKRSRSEDITVNDISNPDFSDENDFFDKRE